MNNENEKPSPSDAPTQSDLDKLKALVEPSPVIAGLKLRPFSAGSMILLQIIQSPFIRKAIIKPESLFFEIARVLYIQAGPLDEVTRIVRDEELFNSKALLFAHSFSMESLVKASDEIKNLVEGATVGLDFQVDSEAASPNV